MAAPKRIRTVYALMFFSVLFIFGVTLTLITIPRSLILFPAKNDANPADLFPHCCVALRKAVRRYAFAAALALRKNLSLAWYRF